MDAHYRDRRDAHASLLDDRRDGKKRRQLTYQNDQSVTESLYDAHGLFIAAVDHRIHLLLH